MQSMAEDSASMAEDSAESQITSSDKKNLDAREKLSSWLNKFMRIRMTDGRTLVGAFVCTDKDCNVILGSCEEFVSMTDSSTKEEPRVLGLAMVPGQHILSIEVDEVEK